MNRFLVTKVFAHMGTVILAALIACVTAAAFLHAADVTSRLRQTSDSVESLVAAHAVLNGNVLLSGWRVPVDDFFATDTLPYVAVEWLLGPRPFLLVLVPALTYAALVLAAALACAIATESFLQKFDGILIVAFLLVCPVWTGRWNPILFSDFHVGSTLGALVALSLCALIAARENLGRIPVISAALLAVVVTTTVASDPFSLVFAFGPALLVLALDSILTRRIPPLGVGMLVTGIAAGILLPLAIAQLGHGFVTENRLAFGFTAVSRIPGNLLALLGGLLSYFGANVFERRGDSYVFLGLRALAFALALIGTIDVARHFTGTRRALLFDRFLCAGILSLFAACILSAKFGQHITPETVWVGSDANRYLVPAVFFFAVIAGRRLPPMMEAPSSTSLKGVARGLLGIVAFVGVVAGDWPSRMIEQQPRWIDSNSVQRVARWLEQHRLTQGVGEYWSANVITALSGERVQVRSVTPYHGKLVPNVWETDSRAYDRFPQFAIWEEQNQSRMTYKEVRATYPVCASAIIANYHIAVLLDHTALSPCADNTPRAKS